MSKPIALSASGDLDLGAVFFDRADTALRRSRVTDCLPHRDEEVVDLDPVLWREFAAQRHFGLFGSFSFDIVPSVGNAMHMRVYADSRLLITKSDDEIRRFTTHTFERQQFVNFVGDAAAVFIYSLLRNIEYRLRF